MPVDPFAVKMLNDAYRMQRQGGDFWPDVMMALERLVNLDTESQYATLGSAELAPGALRLMAAQAVNELFMLDWRRPTADRVEEMPQIQEDPGDDPDPERS